jgi:hypothetical protein
MSTEIPPEAENKPQQVEVKPIEATPTISLPDLIQSLTPLAQMHYETLKLGQDRNADVQTLALNNEEKGNKRNFIILLCVLGIITFFSSGLMFYMKETQTGVLLLSHAAALGAGIVGGRGLVKHEVKISSDS